MQNKKLILRTTIGIAIDLITKYLFYNVRYLENTSMIRPTLNTGISRSLPVPFILIVGISIIGIVGFARLYSKNKLGRIVTALLIWGTIGNLVDRLIYGGVRDFINIGWFNFPIFNIADIMLSIWVWLWILQLILEKKE